MTKPSGELSSQWLEKRVGDAQDKAKDHFTQGKIEFITTEINHAKREAEIATAERLRMEKLVLHINEPKTENIGVLNEDWGNGYNQAVEELNNKIDQIINQSENK